VNLPSGWELILVLLVVLLVFGSKRLPDSARSLGRSLRIFKAETRGLREDGRKETEPVREALPAPAPKFDPYTGKPLEQSSGDTEQ
jgi:sec-independent protein translocase protein TatA